MSKNLGATRGIWSQLCGNYETDPTERLVGSGHRLAP